MKPPENPLFLSLYLVNLPIFASLSCNLIFTPKTLLAKSIIRPVFNEIAFNPLHQTLVFPNTFIFLDMRTNCFPLLVIRNKPPWLQFI